MDVLGPERFGGPFRDLPGPTLGTSNGPTKDLRYPGFNHTQKLQCSSFLVMTYFLLRGYEQLPKKELHSSLWVEAPLKGI